MHTLLALTLLLGTVVALATLALALVVGSPFLAIAATLTALAALWACTLAPRGQPLGR